MGIFWHIYVADFENWMSPSHYDPYQGYKTFITNYDLTQTFMHHNEGYDGIDHGRENDTHMKTMIQMWYFGITTLSTIGYGDYSAKSS